MRISTAIRAERTGKSNLAAQVDRLFARTQHYLSSHSDSRGERFSDLLAYPASALGFLSFLGGNSLRSLAVLNSWPLCGVVVVASTSMYSHLRIAARRGLLIKDARVFEQFPKVDTIIFDKTGTLTETDLRMRRVTLGRGFEENHVLSLAAAAERPFRHPLARAFVQEAQRRGLQISGDSEGNLEVGFGVSMRVSGVAVHIGSERFLREQRIAIPDELKSALSQAIGLGHSAVLVALDGKAAASIEFTSPIREGARETVAALRRMGVRHIGILSGDHPAPTEQVADALGVDSWMAEQLPSQKADYIASLQRQGRTVCYVGDGVNDAIALKQANVSISMSQAAGIAQDSADVVLPNLSLEKLMAFASLSRAYETNILRSFALNSAPLAVSLFGTAFLGFGYLTSVGLSNLGLGLGLMSAGAPLASKRKPRIASLAGNFGE